MELLFIHHILHASCLAKCVTCIISLALRINSVRWALGGFPGGSVVKNSSANEGDTGSISGSGRSPGGGNGNPLQYSCLGCHRQRSLVGYIVYGLSTASDTADQLNMRDAYFRDREPWRLGRWYVTCLRP